MQTDHPAQGITGDRSGVGARTAAAVNFNGNKWAGRDIIAIVIQVGTSTPFLHSRLPLEREVMRFQHEADSHIAGRVSYPHNVTAGNSIDHCTRDPLATEIEVGGNS